MVPCFSPLTPPNVAGRVTKVSTWFVVCDELGHCKLSASAIASSIINRVMRPVLHPLLERFQTKVARLRAKSSQNLFLLFRRSWRFALPCPRYHPYANFGRLHARKVQKKIAKCHSFWHPDGFLFFRIECRDSFFQRKHSFLYLLRSKAGSTEPETTCPEAVVNQSEFVELFWMYPCAASQMPASRASFAETRRMCTISLSFQLDNPRVSRKKLSNA
jgi:hypothetical protein